MAAGDGLTTPHAVGRLLGIDEVELRRQFIEINALYAGNIDV